MWSTATRVMLTTANNGWPKQQAFCGQRTLSLSQRRRNRRFGKIRAKVEHVFRVMKCQFGYSKVRYRGIKERRPGLRAACACHLIPRSQDSCVRMTEMRGESRPQSIKQPLNSPLTDQTSYNCRPLSKKRVTRSFLS